MSVETTVPPEFLTDLHYMQDPQISRLLATIVGLGGEVFLLKAEIERLKMALQAAGVCQDKDLDAAARSPAFGAWASKEQPAFAKALLNPLAQAAETRQPGREGASRG